MDEIRLPGRMFPVRGHSKSDWCHGYMGKAGSLQRRLGCATKDPCKCEQPLLRPSPSTMPDGPPDASMRVQRRHPFGFGRCKPRRAPVGPGAVLLALRADKRDHDVFPSLTVSPLFRIPVSSETLSLEMWLGQRLWYRSRV